MTGNKFNGITRFLKGKSIFYTVLLAMIFLFTTSITAYAEPVDAFSGGSGTEADPYLVATAEQLNNVRNHLGKHFKQTKDIDLGVAPYNTDPGWEPIGSEGSPFTGTFDGNGNTISNLTINRTTNFVGLFGFTGNTAQIRNVKLENNTVTGRNYTGALVGNNGGSITNCYATGAVTGTDYVGGLVGSNKGSITNCYATGAVRGTGTGTYVGGLVGWNNGGSITNSYWDKETSNKTFSDGGTGKITAEMKLLATYEGWNFNDTWSIEDGANYGYPFLKDNPPPKYAITVADVVGGTATVTTVPTTAAAAGATVTVNIANIQAGKQFKSITVTDANSGAVTTTETAGESYTFTMPARAVTVTVEVAAPLYAGGNGTEEDPYQVATAEQLYNVRYRLNKHFIQTADIDLGVEPYNTDPGWEPIGSEGSPFTGIFNGNDKTISNLTIKRSTTDYTGLFGFTGNSAQIRNVKLENNTVTGRDYTGGLVGKNGGMITNSYFTGTVIVGEWYVGSLVGQNEGTITYSYATGAVTGKFLVGGLVGKNNEGTITLSYATGAVTGDTNVGGLVGYNEKAWISECYATRVVTVTGSTNVGGLVGYNSYGTITKSYWDKDTSGRNSSAGGEGKTTEQMKLPETYVGWDFNDTWSIEASKNDGYPFLIKDRYAITVADVLGGTANVTTNPATEAAAGATVTVSIAGIEAGQQFKSITVTDADSGAVTTTEVTAGSSYTFNMPAKEVTVTVAVEPIYAITVANIVGGTATLTTDPASKAAAGATITVSIANIEAGKQFKSITVTNADSEPVATTTVTAGESYTFTMPAKAVTVTLELEPIPATKYTITIADVTGGTATVTTDPATEADAGATITVNIANIETGKQFKSITVTDADSGPVTTTVTAGESYTFTMPAKAVTVTVEVAILFAKGSGTVVDPYQIETAEQLNNVRKLLDKHFIQTADIDLGVAPYNADGGWEPIGNTGSSFKGTFNGNGKTINNLTINRSTTNYVGLFGVTGATAKIQNVKLENNNVTGQQRTGALVGENQGTITNSCAMGAVTGTGTYIGGLVGFNGGAISGSYTTGTVNGQQCTGGLVGDNYKGTITLSYSTGTVNGKGGVGGLAGSNSYTSITNSYARGAVTGTENNIGGLVGWTCDSTITNTYATGAVAGAGSVGGLVGTEGTVLNSYWDKETSNKTSSYGGTGKTTAEMKLQGTYEGWDFNDTWSIEVDGSINDGYPFLIKDRYAITVADVLGGTANVTTNPATEAAAGATVTVSIAGIEAGQQFKSITVTDADSGAVTTTEVTAGSSYTFNMPAKEVTVTVAVEQVQVATSVVTVSKDSAANRETGVTFSVQAVDGVNFYYTLDGTNPTSSSTQYTDTVTLTAPDNDAQATITIKVIGTKAGATDSEVTTKTVTYAAKPDNTAPTPGNSGTITTASVADTSLTLNWTKATDNVTAESNLKYFVYQSTSNDITTVSDAETNGTLLNTGGTADIATYNVIGLTAETTYYFNVVVANEAGNKVAYTAKEQKITATPITSATINPTTTAFDKAEDQADATTTITWNSATSVSAIKKGDAVLMVDTDYTVEGNTLTIKKEYLAEQETGELELTIEFDKGHTATLTIDITDPAEIDECFIATAAFGSKFSWPVEMLRHFRDQYLLSNAAGTAFVKFYYQNSPPIAAVIANNPTLKTMVRVLLAPLVATVFLLYHPAILLLVMILAIVLITLRFMRRRYILG